MSFPQQADLDTDVAPAQPRPVGTGLPDPENQPLMTIPEAGWKAYGIRQTAAYAAAKRGELPIITQGRRKLVPTATLRRMLGMDGGDRHVPAA